MASGPLNIIVPQIDQLFNCDTATATEGELLERFVTQHDKEAFEALVRRHGPMVLGVCRQLLGDRHDAEDAFQAVFLVLVRKARSIRDPNLLGNWLYGVALRTVRQAKSRLARQHKYEEDDAMSGSGTSAPADQAAMTREQAKVLHDEIKRLPKKYRVPVVLCYLKGMSTDEVAGQLNRPSGTIKSQLSRARGMLRTGLTRRGLTWTDGMLTPCLTRGASAALPSKLVQSTIQAATGLANGGTLASLASTQVASLTKGVLCAMLLPKLITTVAFIALAIGSCGAMVLLNQPERQPAVTQDRAPLAPDPAKDNPIVNSIGMKLIHIQSGEFTMGSNEYNDEKPLHRVIISRSFDVGVHEVSQGQYKLIMGENPSQFSGSDSLPVEMVTWLDAVEFCNKLSKKEGLKPYYQIEGTGNDRTVTIPDPTGVGYRLLTEAEWEYACRAGTRTKFSSGDDAIGLQRYAWFKTNSEKEPHPAGQKLPNAWGLHDVHGNVWEWVWDSYDERWYKQTVIKDPFGPSTGGSNRVLRGGGFEDAPEVLRSAHRFKREPSFRSWAIGFRIARNSN